MDYGYLKPNYEQVKNKNEYIDVFLKIFIY